MSKAAVSSSITVLGGSGGSSDKLRIAASSSARTVSASQGRSSVRCLGGAGHSITLFSTGAKSKGQRRGMIRCSKNSGAKKEMRKTIM
mmetsp:Transcript_12068/g.24008  ORF Transcript_12068/g.24008 Transcript_12068/m.24008 type:complete len:88 (-) Transcript_12068:180-443(-)